MRTAFMIGLGLALLSTPAAAQEDYLDDRSGPVSLIRSLYNAINSKEYARAWSYFATPPADSLDAYATGYADTTEVELRTGRVSEEGAAGSIHFRLPVAIEAHGADGGTRVFSGCYEMRMANPAIATDDFTPLQVVGGRFAVSDKPLDDSVPASCNGGAETVPVDLTQERAIGLYERALGDLCQSMSELTHEELTPEGHTLTYRYAYEDISAPEREARLFRFPCNRGAYNESHVYVLANQYDELRLLSFATPELDIRYRDDDREGPVDAIYVIGFRTAPELVNSEYDPVTRTLTSWSKWRGLGDAASTGKWLFRDGEFTLVRFDVDASYDGDINPETVLDYMTGP